MNRLKAEARIRRKVAKSLPCPFCGKTPTYDIRCDTEYSSYGSWGHYAVRKRCCSVTGSGQTELFYCNDYKKPDYRLWCRMAIRLINDWNQRV